MNKKIGYGILILLVAAIAIYRYTYQEHRDISNEKATAHRSSRLRLPARLPGRGRRQPGHRGHREKGRRLPHGDPRQRTAGVRSPRGAAPVHQAASPDSARLRRQLDLGFLF